MAKRWYLDIGRNSGNRGNFVRVYLSRRFFTQGSGGAWTNIRVSDPYKNTGDDGQFTKEFVEKFNITFFAKRTAGIEILNNNKSTSGRKKIKLSFKGGDDNNIDEYEREVYLFLAHAIYDYYDIHYFTSDLGSLHSDPEINWRIRPVLYQDNLPVDIQFDIYGDNYIKMATLYDDGIGTDLVPFKDVPNDTQMFDNPFEFDYDRFEEYNDPQEFELLSSQTSGLEGFGGTVGEQTVEEILEAAGDDEDVVLVDTTSYGTPGDFELCKDLADEDVTPICPECVPNQSYLEPNIIYHVGSYYNELTCEYVTVLEPNSGTVSLVMSRYGGDFKKYAKECIEIQQANLQDETVLHNGLKKLARDYEKTQINGFFVGPVDDLFYDEDRKQPLEVPLENFTRIDHAVIPDTGQVKIKLSVQKRYFELLPPNESPEVDEAVQAGVEKIEIEATKFYTMILRLRAAVKVYQKFYEGHLLNSRGYLYKIDDENKVPVFSSDFDSLRRDLKTFRKHLFSLIEEEGYKINSLNASLPFANKKVDKILIKFDNDISMYSIKSISVKPIGCRYRQIYEASRDSELRMKNGEPAIFTKSPLGFVFNPFAMIGQINNINDDVQAYEDFTWEQFFVKYLVPAVALEYGTLNSPLNDRANSLSCALDQFPNFGEFLKSSLTSLETVFELLAFEFNKITCAEDTEKAIAEFEKRYTSKGNLIDQFKKGINRDSGIASYLTWAFQQDNYDVKDIIGSLTFCELDGLLRLILECLLGGISFEDALNKIVIKLLSSLTARHIGKLIGFLPASKQAEIEDRVQAIIGNQNVGQPWSSNFAGGVSQDSKPKASWKNMSTVSSTSQEPARVGDTNTFALVNEDLAGATPEQVEQMNVDSKVSQVTNVILQAYIDALMEVVPIDDLINYVDKLPITQLIRTLIVGFFGQCQTTPLNAFTDIGMFLPKFKIDVCNPMLAIRIPKIPKLLIPSGLSDVLRLVGDILYKIAVQVFIQLILSLLFRILKALDNILCQGLAALAREDGDFMDIFASLLCGASPDTGRDLLRDMVESMKGLPPSLAGDSIDCIFNALSRTISKKEMLLIASGEPVQQNVYDRVARAIVLNCPEYAPYFQDGQAIEDMCKVFPKFLPESERQKAKELADLSENLPICDIVCLNKEQLKNWDLLRQGKLEDLGMSPEQAAEEIDKLNNESLKEFEDMLSAGIGMQDIIADKYDKLLNRDDPCEESSPWNTRPAIIQNVASNTADYVIKPIEIQFYRELVVDKKSILSKILSDTYGNTYVKHKSLSTSIFSRWYYKDQKPEDEDGEAPFEGTIKDRGYFPETIGEDLRIQIVEPEEEREYKTTTGQDGTYKEPVTITYEGLKLLNHYKNNKPHDYIIEYIRSEDFDFKTSNYFINSINQVQYPYEQVENFGYTIRADQNDVTNFVFEKIANYTDISDAPTIQGQKPYAVKYFERFLSSKTLVNSSKADVIYENIFNSLFVFVNNFCLFKEGFNFGFQDEEINEEDIEYLDPNTKQPYDHDEEAKILGVSNNDRVLFLDPKVHGGSYTEPKIYIKPLAKTGWLKIYDAFSNFDPVCDDIETRILPFNGLKEHHNSLLSKLSVDKRLYQDPDCRVDVPFDRIFSPEITAIIDTLVRATLMCYIVDTSVTILPLVSQLKWREENYDSMLAQILFSKMKKEFINQVGRSSTKNNKKIRRHRYWNLFMEQVVQAFQRQVDLNIIVPTEEEERALRQVFLVRKRYKSPDKNDVNVIRDEEGAFNFDHQIDEFREFKLDDESYLNPNKFYKNALAYDEFGEDLFLEPESINQAITVDNPRTTRLKRFRLQTKVFAIRTVEEDVKVLFNRIASQEINRYFNKLNEVIPPEISNLQLYMFNNSRYFIGTNMSIGTTKSESLYAGGQKTGFGEIIEPEYDTDIFQDSVASDTLIETIEQKGAFLVERYVRVNDRAEVTGNSVSPGRPGDTPNQLVFFTNRREKYNLIRDNNPSVDGQEKYFGIVKLKDFREYIENTALIKKDKNFTLSHYFDETNPANFGIRISYIFPTIHSDYDVIKTASPFRNKIQKTYKRGEYTVHPLASFELPFIDETIEEFLSNQTKNNYDNQCLIRNLIKTDEFKEIFEKMFPVQAPVSLLMATLYSSFYSSIGASEKGIHNSKEEEGWDKNKTSKDAEDFMNLSPESLSTTKKLLQKSFQAVYRDQEYEEDESSEYNSSMFGFLKNMIPDLKINLGKYGNRFVEDLDDCDDPVFKLLREK